MKIKTIVLPVCGMAIVSAAAYRAQAAVKCKISRQPWGRTPDGHAVTLYTLTNANGVEARITDYGGIIVSLKVPDRAGRLADVALGYDSLQDYIEHNDPYFGALIGRFGNRIADGKFELNGVAYHLAANSDPNHLHGGLKGFDKVVWEATPIRRPNGAGLSLRYLSKDGEEGYPGNLWMKVVYVLTNKNELRIDYSATTDKDTILNLTQHSYFNLAGAGQGNILSHQLMINANRFTPTDSTSIPTGELRPVQGTPMDFRQPTAIGARIHQDDPQLEFGTGYDHNWVLNRRKAGLVLAARAYEPASGRVMEVYTTEPGIQFYSGNFLDPARHIGKGGKPYPQRAGFALETQHFPDSPNHSNFPTTTLRRGQTYKQTTIYKFLVRR
jgi:aldose 1-epimerase